MLSLVGLQSWSLHIINRCCHMQHQRKLIPPILSNEKCHNIHCVCMRKTIKRDMDVNMCLMLLCVRPFDYHSVVIDIKTPVSVGPIIVLCVHSPNVIVSSTLHCIALSCFAPHCVLENEILDFIYKLLSCRGNHFRGAKRKLCLLANAKQHLHQPHAVLGKEGPLAFALKRKMSVTSPFVVLTLAYFPPGIGDRSIPQYSHPKGR